MRRAIPAFAALIALSQTAMAGVPSCAVVRFYVAKYSEAAAERWARSRGASDGEIETARRCLHRDSVQTASSATRSKVLAPVTERAEQEPAERAPDQEALNVVPVQGQRADPDQSSHDNEPGVDGSNRPNNIEDGSARQASYDVKDDPAPSDAKPTTLRPRYTGATHRADSARGTRHVSWFKRLLDQLTRRRQFSFALLNFRGGPR